MTGRRILVTGSRTWDDALLLGAALAACAAGLEPSTVTVVHGACPNGADQLADAIASAAGWTVERHPAAWHELGRRAGFVRNAHMVNLGADVCLAFIRNGSSGASHAADLAERQGIPTTRYLAAGPDA